MTKDPYRIFEEDELMMKNVDPQWTREELLQQEGLFPLKEVMDHLDLEPWKMKSKAVALGAEGRDAWLEMGIRKVWSHWIVRMKVFAPFYRERKIAKIRRLHAEKWDGKRLLQQRGTFYLFEVCQYLPFTHAQLRYRAKRHERPREMCGIWKDPESNRYLVDMERFGPWVLKLWKERFDKPC